MQGKMVTREAITTVVDKDGKVIKKGESTKPAPTRIVKAEEKKSEKKR